MNDRIQKIIFNPDNIPPNPNNVRRDNKFSVTFYLLLLCSILFVLSRFTTPSLTFFPKNIELYPLLTPTINKPLLYDYPEAFSLIDEVVSENGIDSLKNQKLLPLQAQALLAKSRQLPYWTGIYNILLSKLHDSNSDLKLNSIPLFEKIREGEVWRLFTPCLLHSDFLHIFFNMTWLLILGKQIEKRLRTWRYIFFILIAAIVSNTAQYLMSGSNFIGFSGVVCAMIAFVWIKQKHFPWDGYQLQQSSILFVMIFILGILVMQVLSFVLEASNQDSLHVNIANTAHISGAIVGYLLGRFKNPIGFK